MTHDYDWKNFIPAPEVRRDFIGGLSAMTDLTWRKQGKPPEPILIGGRIYYRKDELKPLRKKQLAPEQQCKERAQLEVRMEQARMARTEDSTNDE